MIESLQFDVTLTKADMIRARLIPYYRSGWGIVIAVAGIGFAANSVSMRTRGVIDQPDLPTDFLPAIVCLFIIPAAVAFAGINGKAVKNFLGVILRYEFSPAGFRLSTPKLTGYVEWAEVRRAYESSHYFVLSTPGALQILPKQGIGSSAVNELRTLLREALGTKAKVQRPSKGTSTSR
jgi:hypothetical protein